MNDCAICQHPDRGAIDTAIRSGMAPPMVARRFGLSALAVFTHRRHVADLPKPEPPAVEPVPSSEAAPVEPVEPPKPPRPPDRAPKFREWDAAKYHYAWTLQPHLITRQLTPQEICNPAWNPAHPSASSEPPEVALRRTIRPGEGGRTFEAMEERRDKGL